MVHGRFHGRSDPEVMILCVKVDRYMSVPVSHARPLIVQSSIMSSFSTEVSQNRFSTVDSNHHGGILWITSSLSLTYFSLSCILRMYLSYRHFTKDATSLLVATVCLAMHPILRQPLLWKKFAADLSCLGFWLCPCHGCVCSIEFRLRHINRTT